MSLLLRVAGGVIAFILGAATAILEVFRSVTYGYWMLPVVALVNVLLFWFAQSTVDTRWAWLLAAAPWSAVMLLGLSPTPENDLIANSWEGLAMFAAGMAAFVVMAALQVRPRSYGPAA